MKTLQVSPAPAGSMPHRDWFKLISRSSTLLLVTFLLTLIGLLAIYSSSSIKAAEQFGDPFLFLRKQAIAAVLGFLMIFVFSYIPFRWVQRSTLPLVGVAIFLLGLILIPGIYLRVGGAARWISIAGFSFQPSELAKITLVLFLAKNLSRPRSQLDKVSSSILSNILVFGIFAALLFLQPDFGSIVLMFLVTFLMLFVGGLHRKLVAISIVTAVTGFIGAVWWAPYRLKRILSFLDPWSEIKRGGFQIIQSYLGFQNGGLLGIGLGESKQKRFFLPEAHTDFILSVVGEELGLIGVLLVISLFMFISYLGFQIALSQTSPYKRFLGFGLTSLITLQATINMGVTMGLLPTKGIPLPFVSSGASSLTIFLLAIAIISKLGAKLDNDAPKAEPADEPNP